MCADAVIFKRNSVLWCEKSLNDFDYKERPRVWIELKERGTWWGVKPGGAAKAFLISSRYGDVRPQGMSATVGPTALPSSSPLLV